MHLVIINLIFLGLALLCYRTHPSIFLAIGLLFSFFTSFVVAFSAPWLLLIYPVTFTIWGLFRIKDWKWWKFSGTLIAATAAVWGIAMLEFLPQWREIQELARDYPVQRIDQRLAYETTRQVVSIDHDNKETDAETLRLAGQIQEKAGEWEWYDDHRAHALAALEKTHDDFVAAFTRQPGFGIGRMQIRPVNEEYIRMPEPPSLTLPPPPRISVSAGNEQSSKPGTPVEVGEFTRDWHASSVVNFSNPEGFGHLIKREASAARGDGEGGKITARGFETHAFQSIPEGSPWGREWQLTRLELLSLLKHDPPEVYLSESLPRMEELSSEKIPTRPLDEFESIALERLRKGEVIVVRQGRNRVRMLGALLATHECIRCHNVTRGQMLGAFSYEFVRKEPLPAPPDEPSEALPPLT